MISLLFFNTNCFGNYIIYMLGLPQMYGARPIRRWLQKNVMTVISEMLVKGEADEGSTISIDATDDNKGLKYEVVKKE